MRGGYDVSQALHLWRKMAAENPASIHLAGTTHPSTAKRFVALGAALEEIRLKQENGAPLIPDLKEKTYTKEEGMGGLNE